MPLRRCWRSWQRGGVWAGWAEILGVVSGVCRLEMAGWRAYLPVGLSHTPNVDVQVGEDTRRGDARKVSHLRGCVVSPSSRTAIT